MIDALWLVPTFFVGCGAGVWLCWQTVNRMADRYEARVDAELNEILDGLTEVFDETVEDMREQLTKARAHLLPRRKEED